MKMHCAPISRPWHPPSEIPAKANEAYISCLGAWLANVWIDIVVNHDLKAALSLPIPTSGCTEFHAQS